MNKTQLFLARRYAQAFLNEVYESLQTADIAYFKKAADFFETHQHACFLMDLSLLSAFTKHDVLQALVEKYNLPPLSKKLLSLLVAQKRSALIPYVFRFIIQLYQQRACIVNFFIESSLPLSDQEKKEIENFLKDQVQAVVVCSYSLNTDLIAGVRMYNEKYLWEYSAQAQLRALQTSVRH